MSSFSNQLARDRWDGDGAGAGAGGCCMFKILHALFVNFCYTFLQVQKKMKEKWPLR